MTKTGLFQRKQRMNCHLKQTQGGPKQIEGIKYRALLLSVLVTNCERQSNLWYKTRDISRLSVSVPTYASAQTVLDTIGDLCEKHLVHVARFTVV